MAFEVQATLHFNGRVYKYATIEHLVKGTVDGSPRMMMQMAGVVYNTETLQFDKHRYCGQVALNRLLDVSRLVGVNAVKACAEIFGTPAAMEMIAEMEPHI